MPDPWVAVEATVRRSDKLAALPSDTARWGWLVMLGEAKLLRRQGSFTPALWAEVMGRYAKYQADYVALGLLHVAPDYCDEEKRGTCLRGRESFQEGTLVVHDWPRHQREHAVRQQNYRDGQGDAESDGQSDVLGDASSDVRSDIPSRALSLSSVSSSSEEGGSGGKPEVVALQRLAEELTGRPYVMANVYGGLGQKAVTEQLDLHGFAAVERAWREVHRNHDGRVTLRQLVFEADEILNPIQRKQSPKDEKQSAIDALRAEAQRRIAANA